MSVYEQPQNANVIGWAEYNATRPSQANSCLPERNAQRASQNLMFLQYGLPGAADPHSRQPPTAYDRQDDHMNYRASANDQPPAALEATPSAYHDFDLRTALAVTSYSPKSGTKGSLVSICLVSSSELRSSTSIIATLMFATRSVSAALTFDRTKPQEQDVGYRYMIYANAPAFSETGSSSLKVPLCLQLQGQSSLNGDLVDIGEWLYEDDRPFAQEVSRKRKVTNDPLESPRSIKRATLSEQQIAPSQEHESYGYPLASSAYPQKRQTMDFSNMQRRPTLYGGSQPQQSMQDKSRSMRSQGLIGDASIPQSFMRPPMCQTSSCTSTHEAEYETGKISLPSLSPSLPVSSMASPSPRNPTLIRTYLIEKMKKKGILPPGSSLGGKCRPYKPAVLEIHGNLNVMQLNWSSEEYATGRRIVGFWREQHGITVNTCFRSLRADEPILPHDVNECRISCMYWDDRNEYYVTSVDIIALLELLVGTPLSTEEKNRIRRNLEKAKPSTISKTKPESRDFFKMAMAFINPKPRNIDKDVKVYPWSELAQALKQVVCRYSENPFGHTVPIERSSSSTFSGTHSESGMGQYSDLSSRSTPGSATSTAYRQTLKPRPFSPSTASHGLPSSHVQASPLQYLSPPSLAHAYTTPAFDSPYVPYHTFDSPYTTPISTPDLSSSYTTSTIGRRRISDAPKTEVLLASSSTGHYSGNLHPFTGGGAAFAPLESIEATAATLGLPGRASRDFSAYFNTGVASPADAALYARHSGAGVKDEMAEGMMCFKEEM